MLEATSSSLDETMALNGPPEVGRLQDNMLSRAHQAIDRLGASLLAKRAALEEERRRLAAAWHQVHEARQAREEEWR